MSEEKLFEKATRKKLRFTTSNGAISVEQAWDLPLTGKLSLDSVAKSVNRNIKNAEEESFVTTPRTAATDDSLRLEILKHIIAVRLDEKTKSEERVAKQYLLRKVEGVMAKREDEVLLAKTPEELAAMAKELRS